MYSDRAFNECAQLEGAADAVTLRAVFTSWERFPIKEVQTLPHEALNRNPDTHVCFVPTPNPHMITKD